MLWFPSHKPPTISRRGFLRAAGITLFTSIAVPKLILPETGELVLATTQYRFMGSMPPEMIYIAGRAYHLGATALLENCLNSALQNRC